MRYRIPSAVAWRVVDDEGVLLHSETSAYFGLNRTGTLLFSALIERPLDEAELLELAAGHFRELPADAPTQLAEFLAELASHRLLEPATGTVIAAALPLVANGFVYERPVLLHFGELEKLILSGE